MQKGAHSAMDLREQPCRFACSLACMQSGMAESVRDGMLLPMKQGRCACGFSGLQINALSVLKARHEVISYWQIASLIQSTFSQQTTEDAVRGALGRLYRQGFMVRQRTSRAHLKGNRYAFNADPCRHIRPYTEFMRSGMESATRTDVNSAKIDTTSILEEIDRKNLSISSGKSGNDNSIELLEALSEEDIAFHWPVLSGMGFGTHQVRQIVSRLSQVDIETERVMQGLTHAEWELAENLMRDKTGTPIANPVSWVFKILATQGYYPRPEGYCSPQEQAERDAVKERKRFAATQEEHLKAACDAWIAGLSPDERNAIQGAQNGSIRIPGDVLLRNHFRTEVWPKLQKGSAK